MAQVAIKRCSDYNPENVQQAVNEAVVLLGGIEKFVRPGQKVLIKPNMLSARPPESGVCTHPEVARAVIKLVKRVTGSVYVGDSHGGFDVINMDNVYEASGIKKICQEEGVELVRFDSVKAIDGIPFASIISGVDVVINLPKMKTHGFTALTGAVKNIFGTVVGKYKAECHFRFEKKEDFCFHLVKIFSHVKPALNLMDGIVAMEGDGPTAGTLRKSGLILASPDAVALDAVFTELAGIKAPILTTTYAGKMGLGVSDISLIEISGEKIENARMKDFKLPQATFFYNPPAWSLWFLGKLLRSYPFVKSSVCISCRICEKNCPAKAIDIDRYHIDYSKCIYCFCCHELCPHSSIGVRKTLAGKLFSFLMEVRRRCRSKQ